MRARDLLPQLARHRPPPSFKDVNQALFMILFGLFFKAVIADNVGAIVEEVTKMMGPSNSPLPPGMGFIFMYGFAFQIYCDFAAYTTIARGSAKLFNVDLMRNFLTPYLSANPSEFWQRWHISLSTWLRDYLYIPLGGNRHGTAMTMRNLMITMTLAGLWHGAGIFFIVWGVYHGLLLILYRLTPIDAWLEKILGKRLGKAAAIIIFFHLVCFGWIFFRATPEQFLPIWRSIISFPGAIASDIMIFLPYFAHKNVLSPEFFSVIWGTIKGVVSKNWYFSVYGWGILLFVLPAVLTDIVGWRRGVEFPDLYERMPLWFKAVLILLLIYSIEFFGVRESSEFIYFAF